jgi:glycosyltransferase involved in cell wall biosynthesis
MTEYCYRQGTTESNKEFYDAATVSSPARSEGFGLGMITSMYMKKPVVATGIGIWTL